METESGAKKGVSSWLIYAGTTSENGAFESGYSFYVFGEVVMVRHYLRKSPSLKLVVGVMLALSGVEMVKWGVDAGNVPVQIAGVGAGVVAGPALVLRALWVLKSFI